MPYIGNIVQDFSVNTAMLNSDSVTSIKIDDGTIVNADINASAAIDVSKLSGVLPLAGGTLTGDLTIPEKLIHSGDTDTFFSFPAADIAAVDTAGSERLRVDASGRLLIGTTVPRSPASATAQIQLEGTNAATSSLSLTRNSANNGGPNLIFNKTRGTAVGADTSVNSGDTLGFIIFTANDGIDSDNIAASIAAKVDGTPGTDDMPGNLIFSTTSDGANDVTERLRITSAGKVGIGTSAPESNFHVHGDALIEDTVGNHLTIRSTVSNGNDPNFLFEKARGGGTPAIVQNGDDIGNFQWRGYDGNSYEVGASILAEVEGTPSDGDMPMRMTFRTRSAGAGSEQGRIQISADGTVSLVNNSNLQIPDKIIHSGDTNTSIRFPAADTFTVETSGSERFRITSDGKIGIGTSTPQYKLHQHVSGSGNNYHQFTNDTTGAGAAQGMLIGLNSSEEFIVYNRENTALRFGTNNTERARITNNGDVLIGTTTEVVDTSVHIDGNIAIRNTSTGTGTPVKTFVLSRSYTMSTSSTNVLTFDNWGTAAFDITVFRNDTVAPAGANVTKVYLAFHGSGQNITQASIAQDSKVTRGSIHNVTYGISENNNTATLTATGDDNAGEAQSLTFYIIGRGNNNGNVVVA